tara:strand:+ start:683 stop:1108 length:426 start_codon:yes stop_codon:yes gene_type:complete
MEIKKEAIIFEKKNKVFNIVNRVNLYKNFVPYCIDSKIISEQNNQMEAKLDFNVKGIKTSFTTKNLIKHNEFIEMKLVDGPFKYLDGKWVFKEVGDKTIIKLSLKYEVKSKILDYAFGKSLEKISDILVKSFVAESKKRHE